MRFPYKRNFATIPDLDPKLAALSGEWKNSNNFYREILGSLHYASGIGFVNSILLSIELWGLESAISGLKWVGVEGFPPQDRTVHTRHQAGKNTSIGTLRMPNKHSILQLSFLALFLYLGSNFGIGWFLGWWVGVVSTWAK